MEGVNMFNSSKNKMRDYIQNNGFDPSQPRDDKGMWTDTGGYTKNDGGWEKVDKNESALGGAGDEGGRNYNEPWTRLGQDGKPLTPYTGDLDNIPDDLDEETTQVFGVITDKYINDLATNNGKRELDEDECWDMANRIADVYNATGSIDGGRRVFSDMDCAKAATIMQGILTSKNIDKEEKDGYEEAYNAIMERLSKKLEDRQWHDLKVKRDQQSKRSKGDEPSNSMSLTEAVEYGLVDSSILNNPGAHQMTVGEAKEYGLM